MRRILCALLLLSAPGFSQQIPHLSQWFVHQMAINPAHTGIKNCLDAQATARGQWIGMAGAPATGWLTVSAPLKAKRRKFLSARHGLGGVVNYDQQGAFQQFTFQLSYAGHFNFTQDNRLSLGLSAGATQLAFDINKALPGGPDPTINGSAVELQPTATFGAWWNGKNYYAGMALYNLIPQKWTRIGTNAASAMHGMINAGIRMPLSQDWAILSGLYAGFVKAAPLDLQLHVLADFRGRFSTGLGYRTKDAVILFIGYRFEEKWRIMYSFDYVMSSLRPGTWNTHELTIAFSPCKIHIANQNSCPLFE